MTLKKVVLENYGVFANRHVFDVTPRSVTRPVILFGGHNGSGKTTIIEAIRLALHGRRALGNRVARNEYGAFLAERTHRGGQRDGVRRAMVEVEVSHVQSGISTDYSVVRSWVAKGQRTNDSLTVYRGGDILKSLEQDQWDDFVEDLLPARLADLYFFDAERIEALADESTSGQALSDSLNSILGLDAIDQLTADLSLYLGRHTDDKTGSRLGKELSTLNDTLAAAQRDLTTLRHTRAVAEAEAGRLDAKLHRAKSELLTAGGSFAQRAEETTVRAATIARDLDRAERDARELCAGLLPFSIAGSLLDRLQARLASDTARRAADARAAVATQFVDALTSVLTLDDTWSDLHIRNHDIEVLRRRILHALHPIHDQYPTNSSPVIHGVGDRESSQLAAWCNRLHGEEQERFLSLCHTVEDLHSQRTRSAEMLRAIPEEDQLDPLVQRFETDARRHAEMKSHLRALDDQLDIATKRVERLGRNRRRLSAKLSQIRHTDRKVALAANTVAALGAYGRQLTRRKIAQLQHAVLERFRTLAHKTDLISAVHICPKTYTAALQTAAGQTLAPNQLSAGEKQLFAIAMLWALRQVSGRPLPIVIDTPMGRLDTEHRDRLVTSYFPSASHQVLILSTDTEVDRQYFNRLQPAISRAFRLQYNGEDHSTTVAPGYFWKPPLEH